MPDGLLPCADAQGADRASDTRLQRMQLRQLLRAELRHDLGSACYLARVHDADGVAHAFLGDGGEALGGLEVTRGSDHAGSLDAEGQLRRVAASLLSGSLHDSEVRFERREALCG